MSETPEDQSQGTETPDDQSQKADYVRQAKNMSASALSTAQTYLPGSMPDRQPSGEDSATSD